MVKLNGAKNNILKCLIFAVITGSIIILAPFVYTVVDLFYEISFIGLMVFFCLNYFHNPVWLLACHFCAIKILGLKQANVINLLLPTFCFGQVFVLFSGLLEPVVVLFASGDMAVVLGAYILWQVLTCVAGTLLLVFFNLYIKRNTNRFRVIIKADKKIQNKLLIQNYMLILLIWVGIVLTASLSVYYSSTVGLLTMLVSLLIIMILIMILGIRTIFQKTETENLQAHLEALTSSIDDFKETKHEFYNVLQMYEGYIKLRNYEGLESFHNKLFSQTLSALSGIDVPKLSSRPALYGLMLNAGEQAKQNNVKLYFYQLEGLAYIDMPDYDLCRILIILFNNAIENAALSDEKTVSVMIKMITENEGMVILNNATDKMPDMSKIFLKGYSTKSDHQGRGLYDVRNILSSCPGFSITADCSKKVFSIYFKVVFRQT